MGILYDIASFPVKSVINSLHSSENTEHEHTNETDHASNGNMTEVINCNKVRLNYDNIILCSRFLYLIIRIEIWYYNN